MLSPLHPDQYIVHIQRSKLKEGIAVFSDTGSWQLIYMDRVGLQQEGFVEHAQGLRNLATTSQQVTLHECRQIVQLHSTQVSVDKTRTTDKKL